MISSRMKSLLVLCAMAALASAAYENLEQVEVEPIVADPEAMRAFVGCYLDKTVCNELTGQFEAVHSEIIEKRCARCSRKLKHGIRRFYEEFPKVHPQKWAEYRQKFGEENIDGLIYAVSKF